MLCVPNHAWTTCEAHRGHTSRTLRNVTAAQVQSRTVSRLVTGGVTLSAGHLCVRRPRGAERLDRMVSFGETFVVSA